jgi:hypothetical protein
VINADRAVICRTVNNRIEIAACLLGPMMEFKLECTSPEMKPMWRYSTMA